ncbi:MAG: UDP-4-amino-4,6-dideoxy-N-acetyl-beta-L-altrosamine N-acetyltransferase [Clostridiales bacterium]|jgi:diamine N-acetyltransferase|nr:UDP-4-amino-4,6-dideoxy-N-acetyl-beta-L-altrosamine N-acetyltransferase [Eubacteriales bacterium]MDH7566157.1 UDP-4-amino-4,6-dideoxy-N-acetyl-beta-L-altrosamine N-acetyltransferase [Clostridiales bacterium]
MLETDRLILKLLDEEDEKSILAWRNQKDIIDSLFCHKGITLKEHREWYEKYLRSGNRIEFIIIVKNSGRKIGTVGLSNIDYRNQKAEYGIFLGEKAERGKGYGKEASCALISYGFNELNLRRIYLKVFRDNRQAVKLYKNLGFNEEGILRKDVYKNGKFKDVMIMSILKDEWKV